jgi:hypothetical protein
VLRTLQALPGAVQVPDGRHVADSHRFEQHAPAPMQLVPLAAQGLGPHSIAASLLAASDRVAASASAAASALAPASASATLASWPDAVPTRGARSTDSTLQATTPPRTKTVEKAAAKRI